MNQTELPGIELAPGHKTGLRLRNPIMIAAGCYGTGTEYRGLVEAESLGAIVVGPVTLNPRRGAEPPRVVPVRDGILLHTGLANPGLSATLRQHAKVWSRSPIPIILHLASTTPQEVAIACERLTQRETVAAVELGLGSYVTPQETFSLVSAAAETWTGGPLLVRLPIETCLVLAEPAVEAGAASLTIAAPPRGTVLARGQPVSGRLYGPFVLPMAARAVQQVAEIVQVPLIGCGGVYTTDDVQTLLQLGATAVQVDAALWRDPSTPARLARELADHTHSREEDDA